LRIIRSAAGRVKHASAVYARSRAFTERQDSAKVKAHRHPPTNAEVYGQGARNGADMDIWIWLLIAVLVLTPRQVAAKDVGFEKVRSVTLLLGLLYLVGQAAGV